MAMAAASPAAANAAAPSFIDAVGKHILASADSIEAQIDAEAHAKRLASEQKLTSRGARNAITGLKDLVRRAPEAVVTAHGAVAAVLRAVAKLSPSGNADDEDFDAVEPLQDCLEMLAMLLGDSVDDQSSPAYKRGQEVAELIVRHTENCKGLLRLLIAADVSTEYDAMVLLQRIYRRFPAPVDAALLANPDSFAHLMQTLQTCQIDYVRNECLALLILLTASNKDIQTIVTVQGLVETVFVLLEEEDLTVGGKVARDLLQCFMNLVNNTTCQKYIRETGGASSLVASMAAAFRGSGNEGEEEEDDFAGARETAEVSDETRWACLVLLTDAALALVGRPVGGRPGGGEEGDDSAAARREAVANQDALIRAGALDLCNHLLDAKVALSAKLKVIGLFDALAPNPLAAKRLMPGKETDGTPIFNTASEIVLGSHFDLPLRSALGRVLGRAVVQHGDMQSFLCSSLGPQLDFVDFESFLVAELDEEPAKEAAAKTEPVGRQVVEILENVAAGNPSDPSRAWFALHFVIAMLFGNADVQSVCVSMPIAVPSDAGPPETFLDLILRAFSAAVRACQEKSVVDSMCEGDLVQPDNSRMPKGPETPSATLMALLKLLVHWLGSCPAALARFAGSPVTLQLAVDLATSGSLCGPFITHIEGLACLLLGLCICADEGQVDVNSLMALLANKVGIEEFQRKVDRLWRSEMLQRPPRPLSSFRWYGSRYRALVRERQQLVQRKMVQLYVAGSVGSGGAALSEDVADHYKQLIRVQDSELREVRKENEHLRGEVETFMRRALQAKSFAVADTLEAVRLENEALHTEVHQLTQEVATKEASLEEAKNHFRGMVCDMEQQLQSIAVAYEQLDMSAEATTQENAELRAELDREKRSRAGAVASPTENASAALERRAERAERQADEVRAERDDLLELLGRIAASCPDAARFVAPLGQLAAPQQASAAAAVGTAVRAAVATSTASAAPTMLPAPTVGVTSTTLGTPSASVGLTASAGAGAPAVVA
eukprot:TRINITY_DN5863_c0_g3_i1.p1 TRINITY_DN5863_c0_g3~~TRINITY_DN5863_c0_g3_i1.p1  ORF type:complete len:1022 (-),score=244.12 TRINITY_DN5863_c0_g3_i1:387-3410(-)